MESLTKRQQQLEYFQDRVVRGVSSDASSDFGVIAECGLDGGETTVFFTAESNNEICAHRLSKNSGGTEAQYQIIDLNSSENESLKKTAYGYYTDGTYYEDTDNWIWYPVEQTKTIEPEVTLTHFPPIEKQPNFHFQVASVEIIDEERINESSFIKAGMQRQPDLLYVRFKLMHEGGNKNYDYFEKNHLKAASATPVLKHLNWEHGEPTIGTIYHAEYVDPNDGAAKGTTEKAHIIAEAVIWKFKYPEQSRQIVERHKTGELAFSMEAYFTEAECSKCGSVFSSDTNPDGTYCEHLNKRYDQKATAENTDDLVYRKVNKFILGGAAVVMEPADVGAEGLAIAKQKEVSTLEKLDMTQDQFDAAIKAAVEADREKRTEETNVQELTDKLAAAEASLQEKGDALAEATGTIDTLTTERDEAKAGLKKLEDEVAYEAKASERIKALEDAGYIAPETEEEAEKAFATMMETSDDVFALFVSTLKANKKEEVEEEEKPATTVASVTRLPVTGLTSKKKNEEDPAESAANILARL